MAMGESSAIDADDLFSISEIMPCIGLNVFDRIICQYQFFTDFTFNNSSISKWVLENIGNETIAPYVRNGMKSDYVPDYGFDLSRDIENGFTLWILLQLFRKQFPKTKIYLIGVDLANSFDYSLNKEGGDDYKFYIDQLKARLIDAWENDEWFSKNVINLGEKTACDFMKRDTIQNILKDGANG